MAATNEVIDAAAVSLLSEPDGISTVFFKWSYQTFSVGYFSEGQMDR